jgi:hypothetical protein
VTENADRAVEKAAADLAAGLTFDEIHTKARAGAYAPA